MIDLVKGIGFKLLSLISKVFFLLFIIINFNEGVLSSFLFYSTIAVICATIIGAGMAEHLTILISKNKSIFFFLFKRYFVSINLFLLIYFLLLLFFDNIHLYIVLLFVILNISFGIYMGGLVRSINYLYYEFIINTPNILFLLLSLLIENYSINNVLFVFACSFFITNFLTFLFAYKYYKKRALRYLKFINIFKIKYIEFYNGSKKMVIDLLSVLATRGIIFIPPLLGFHKLTDEESFIFSIAEASTLLFFVFINRSFVKYLNNKELNLKKLFSDIFLILGVLLLINLIPSHWILTLSFAEDIFIKYNITIDSIYKGKLIFSCLIFMALLTLVKYYLWAKGNTVIYKMYFFYLSVFIGSIFFQYFFGIISNLEYYLVFVIFLVLLFILLLLWRVYKNVI